MRTSMVLTGLLAALVAPGTAQAIEPGEAAKPAISVTAMGKATAKADLAVVFLSINSSAPLAADALEQTRKRAEEVKARLIQLGYKEDQIRFSGNRFAPAGRGMYYPGGQRPTGFEVYNNLYIHLEGDALKNLDQFNLKVGTLLDEMGKVGASPAAMPISRISMGGVSVVAFTIKDPTPHETKAYLQAMQQARPIADEISRQMKVQITGVESVISVSANPTIVGGPPTPAEELPYEYLSSSMDEVPVRVRVTVRYSYQ